jgi:hypothetical protein
MTRTSKKERKENAVSFWNTFSQNGRAAIVVERMDPTTTPNINRTRFLSVATSLKGRPVVIAESPSEGVAGCFYELLRNINNIQQVGFHETEFKSWLRKNYHIAITYDDGYVMFVERT